jgi:3-methylcrotonyl-CoA carboxylase alpha subunit
VTGEVRGITYIYQNERYHVTLTPTPNMHGAWQMRVNAQSAEQVTSTSGPDNFLLLTRDHRQTRLHVLRQTNETLVNTGGQVFHLAHLQPPSLEQSAHAGAGEHTQKALSAPMAGTIVKVQVQAGQEVEQRQVLVIFTAMKMEHTIAAPHAGKIRHVYYKEGDVVKGGVVLVEMD